MSNKFFFSALFICCAFSLCAQLPAVTGKRVNKNTKIIEGWLIQAQEADKKTVIVNTDDKGIVTSHVFSPASDGFLFFADKLLKYQKGDTLELTCKVKGSGTIRLGYSRYSSSNKSIGGASSEYFTLTGKEDTFTVSMEIEDGKEFPTAAIRPRISISAKSKVELLDLKIIDED